MRAFAGVDGERHYTILDQLYPVGIGVRALAISSFLSLLSISGSALANLRAPHTVNRAASGAMRPSEKERAEGLVVLGETLAFQCDVKEREPRAVPAADDHCRVTATYRVRAEKDARLAFEFVLPVDQQVSASVGPTPQEVKVAPSAKVLDGGSYDRLRDNEKASPWTRLYRSGPRDPQLYEARFEADLKAGENTIAVSYDQPLGATEHDYGYFKSKGRYSGDFRYEIWPITAWQRDANFKIAVTISSPRRPPGWWKRKFGTVKSVGCRGWGGETGTYDVLRGNVEQQGDRMVYSASMGPKLPDVLECAIGDEDVVPRAR